MARFLVAAVLAVCVSYASAQGSWTAWKLRDECDCGPGGRGEEVYQRDCYGDRTACPRSYEERRQPCDCSLVFTPGEIAGIAVGGVVFLILIIILMVWCCYCCGCDCGGCMDCMGCDCDEGGCGGCMGCGGCGGCRRYESDDDMYRGKPRQGQMMQGQVMQGQVMQGQVMQAPQPAPVYMTGPPMMRAQPTPQFQRINFSGAVIQPPPQQSATYFVG